VERLRGAGYLEDLRENGKIIIKLILRDYGKKFRVRLIWLRIRLK
jgi:hypothetical protein